jgi:hypothetical protein
MIRGDSGISDGPVKYIVGLIGHVGLYICDSSSGDNN